MHFQVICHSALEHSLDYVSDSPNNLSNLKGCNITLMLLSIGILRLNNNPWSPGTIPPSFYDLSALEELNLASCNLNGILGEDVANWKNLVTLDLSENNLNGDLPTNIGAMTQVVELYLGRNDFEGFIPSEIGLLGNLGKHHAISACRSRCSCHVSSINCIL